MDPILRHVLKFWKMRYQLMIYVSMECIPIMAVKKVENIRHYNITHNLPASQKPVQPRKLHRNLNFAWVEALFWHIFTVCFNFLFFLGNVKDQLYIKQRHLTQMRNRIIYKMCWFISREFWFYYYLRLFVVFHFFLTEVFLLLSGDIEKNPGPFDASKLSTLDDAIFGAQNGIKFLLFNARSMQNKYQDISNLLQQLDSETIVIVTGTWMTEEQSLNINLSAEQKFLDKNWSHQTWAAEGEGVGRWIPKKLNLKRRRIIASWSQIFWNVVAGTRQPFNWKMSH